MKKQPEGLHQNGRRDADGRWTNTCLPRSRRSGDTKAEKRLAKRLADFDHTKAPNGNRGFIRPGSLKKG